MTYTTADILAAREELAKRKLGRGIPALEPLLQPARYKGAWGGRGSGKSNTMAEMVVRAMVINPDCNVVCVREVQKSLALSAKKLIEGKIEQFRVGHLFEVQQSLIKRRGGKGICIFQGLQDHTADSIKSLEGFDIAWVEEAQSISERSMELLRPTIRKDGSELWFSWNPRRRADAIEKLLRSRNGERADAIVLRANYTDNPHLPDVLLAEANDAKATDQDTYDHVWLGAYESMGSKVVIPAAWVEAAIGLAQDLGIEVTGRMYSALDVAGGEDGGDENAQAVRHGIELIALDTWNGMDGALTLNKAMNTCDWLDVTELMYDPVGVGESITATWADLGRRGERLKGLSLVPWNGGATVLDPDKRVDPLNIKSLTNKNTYHNLKAQGGFALRRRFENAWKARRGEKYDADMLISIPRDLPELALLQDELSQPQHKQSATGKVMIDKAPDDAKSPNRYDAVMMAYWPLKASYSMEFFTT